MEDKSTSERTAHGAKVTGHSAPQHDAEGTKAGRIPAEQLQAAARVAEAGLRRLNGGRTSAT